MTDFTFADRYAQAGLTPTAEIMGKRKEVADRIADDLTSSMLFDLVGTYYGWPKIDLTWFRDEFSSNDVTFSLVQNERETKVLAAIILGDRIADEDEKTILAVAAGNVMGRRLPTEASWLVTDTLSSLGQLAVYERRPPKIETKVTPTTQQKLTEEISAVGQNDWPTLLQVVNKVRSEAQSSMKTMATQTANALNAINTQLRLQREETQMLWWIFGGHSRALEKDFASLAPAQAAIVAAVDLANLTSVSKVGPIAVPAMIERVIAAAKKTRGAASRRLDEAVEGLSRDDLLKLELSGSELPPPLIPMSTAIDLARTIGSGAWQSRFADMTGLDSSTEFAPLELATQLYREHLIGQLP